MSISSIKETGEYLKMLKSIDEKVSTSSERETNPYKTSKESGGPTELDPPTTCPRISGYAISTITHL